MIATCFALVSFAAAVTVGAVAGNEAHVIILRATLTMLICWVIGRIVGALAQRAMDHHIEQYKILYPIPKDKAHEHEDNEESSSTEDDDVIEEAQTVEQVEAQTTENELSAAGAPT